MGNWRRTGGLAGNLEILFQLKGVGVVQTDLETGRFVRANRTFCEMVGYREADLQALTYEELTHPDDRARDAAIFATFQWGDLRGSDAVTRVLRKDGATVWLELHVSILHEGGRTHNVAVAHDVTERKRAEAALRESEAQFRHLADHAPVMVWVTDPDAVCTYLSRSWYDFTGQTPATGLGAGWLDTVHPEDSASAQATFLAANERRQPFRLEYRLRRADGVYRWAIDDAAPRFGERGQFLGYVGSVIDITERKEAERALQELNAALEQRVEERTKALRQSEQRFSQAFDRGPIAACITALRDGTLLEVNAAFARLTGYDRETAVGKTHRELGLWVPPADQETLRRAQGVDNDIRDLELALRTKTGERKDILLSAGIIELDGERSYLNMFYDITQRKEAEAWRELLRQAMDNAEEAVIITTADLDVPGPRIEYVNRAFIRMTGYEPEEVVGKTPRMFQGPETDRAVMRRMQRRLRAGRTFQGESVNYRKDGSNYILAWNIAPVYDAEGEVSHWVSTQHDVTERRRLEREILDISAREQRRVAGDLHDSVQQQLVGTAMQAKQLVSLTQTRAPDLAAELDALYASVQDGVKSVRAVLAGITPLQESENGLMVALESMCQRVTGLFGTPCGFSFERPLLMSDFERATQLYYVAQEAVINAAKHAKASRIEVRLAGNGAERVLTVSDDGRGLDEEALRRRDGMGLGLMEYRARLIGAQLEVSSVLGQGTTVSCFFDV